MTKVSVDNVRQAWSTPELRRIRAGSAENVKASGIPDGGGGSTNKS